MNNYSINVSNKNMRRKYHLKKFLTDLGLSFVSFSAFITFLFLNNKLIEEIAISQVTISENFLNSISFMIIIMIFCTCFAIS